MTAFVANTAADYYFDSYIRKVTGSHVSGAGTEDSPLCGLRKWRQPGERAGAAPGEMTGASGCRQNSGAGVCHTTRCWLLRSTTGNSRKHWPSCAGKSAAAAGRASASTCCCSALDVRHERASLNFPLLLRRFQAYHQFINEEFSP